MFRLIILLGWSAGILFGSGPESSFTLKNNLSVRRLEEPVVINREDFEKRFTNGNPGEVPVLKLNGRPIPLQLDDINGDGKWDELAFTITVEARSGVRILTSWMPKDQAPVFAKRTQTYLAEENKDGTFTEVNQAVAPVGLAGFPTLYQSEGVGWENDRMAFRIYFDCRNTKDLFGKLIPDLILQKAGSPGTASYHNLAPWGMDILHCGSSLGAGSLALIEKDSLYRLGSTPVYKYAEITEGPVRTIFELQYQNWEVNGKQYEAVEKITLWIGKYWFQSEVTIREFSGEKQLATGIVTTKLDNEPIQFQPDKNFTAILTHGKQSLNNDILAMAVMARSASVTKTGRTGNLNFYQMGYQTVPVKSFSQVISETCYLAQKIKRDIPSVHYFFAMWGLENPEWNDAKKVKDHIRTEANKLSSPLTIKY